MRLLQLRLLDLPFSYDVDRLTKSYIVNKKVQKKILPIKIGSIFYVHRKMILAAAGVDENFKLLILMNLI
jgi:hypothetical protein